MFPGIAKCHRQLQHAGRYEHFRHRFSRSPRNGKQLPERNYKGKRTANQAVTKNDKVILFRTIIIIIRMVGIMVFMDIFFKFKALIEIINKPLLIVINSSKKTATGHGNTQVGQNLLNEIVIINHLTINIQLSGPSGFEAFKKLMKKFKIFNHEKTNHSLPDGNVPQHSIPGSNPKNEMEKHTQPNPHTYFNEWSHCG